METSIIKIICNKPNYSKYLINSLSKEIKDFIVLKSKLCLDNNIGNREIALYLYKNINNDRNSLYDVLRIVEKDENVIKELQKLVNKNNFTNNINNYFFKISNKECLLKYKIFGEHVNIKKYMENKNNSDKNIDKCINIITKQINNAPIFDKGFIVFRGYGGYKNSKLIPIEKKSFTSTSKNYEIAKSSIKGNENCCIQIIYVPEYTNFLYFNDKEDEDEVLLLPGNFYELYSKNYNGIEHIFQIYIMF